MATFGTELDLQELERLFLRDNQDDDLSFSAIVSTPLPSPAPLTPAVDVISPTVLDETPGADFYEYSFSSTSSISPSRSHDRDQFLHPADQAFYGSPANFEGSMQLTTGSNLNARGSTVQADQAAQGPSSHGWEGPGQEDSGSRDGSRPPNGPPRAPSRSRSPSDHGGRADAAPQQEDEESSENDDHDDVIMDDEERRVFDALQDSLEAPSGSKAATDRRQRAKTLLTTYYRKIWPKAPGALPESSKLGRRVAKALIQAIVDEIAQHYHIDPARVWKDVGVFTGYARSSNAWNLYQKRARLESRSGGEPYDAAATRQRYLEQGAADPDLQRDLEEWSAKQGLPDGDQLRPSERQQLFDRMVASAKYIFSNYDRTAQIGGRFQVVGLNPEDRASMAAVWETESMGQTMSGISETGERVLMHQWVTNKYAPLMVNPPADDSVDPRGHAGTKSPGVREMKEAIKEKGKLLLHDAMRLAKPNARAPPFNRWGHHIDEAMIQHQCTLVNWPDAGPFPHDLEHELQNTPQEQLFPVWLAYTTSVSKLKVHIARWSKGKSITQLVFKHIADPGQAEAIRDPVAANPPLIIRVDGTAWTYNEELARQETSAPPSRPSAHWVRDRKGKAAAPNTQRSRSKKALSLQYNDHSPRSNSRRDRTRKRPRSEDDQENHPPIRAHRLHPYHRKSRRPSSMSDTDTGSEDLEALSDHDAAVSRRRHRLGSLHRSISRSTAAEGHTSVRPSRERERQRDKPSPGPMDVLPAISTPPITTLFTDADRASLKYQALEARSAGPSHAGYPQREQHPGLRGRTEQVAGIPGPSGRAAHPLPSLQAVLGSTSEIATGYSATHIGGGQGSAGCQLPLINHHGQPAFPIRLRHIIIHRSAILSIGIIRMQDIKVVFIKIMQRCASLALYTQVIVTTLIVFCGSSY
ncbi:hypothetical protein CALVIDRAFT_529954 [Calocera viscosa TUFC12733]|uniref:Uncharacterized protein n=1 Tax=Calocera viscosa (strain TUFC12733) TaxID=1330018 RepID=A0A167IP62_CALVF|nr:hypothetical protein CALVIDRAFT_529954 [Calocera viscosa TUFC12733]